MQSQHALKSSPRENIMQKNHQDDRSRVRAAKNLLSSLNERMKELHTDFDRHKRITHGLDSSLRGSPATVLKCHLGFHTDSESCVAISDPLCLWSPSTEQSMASSAHKKA